MIPWWWLLVEAGVLVLLAASNRGATRAVALHEALTDPEKAASELRRRWKLPVEWRP